jgi:hypothetical protein
VVLGTKVSEFLGFRVQELSSSRVSIKFLGTKVSSNQGFGVARNKCIRISRYLDLEVSINQGFWVLGFLDFFRNQGLKVSKF